MKDESSFYIHDCPKCVYLGFDKSDKGIPIDLYFCGQHGIPTVIARYSSQGSDYVSGLALASHFPELMTAKMRATAAGHLY